MRLAILLGEWGGKAKNTVFVVTMVVGSSLFYEQSFSVLEIRNSTTIGEDQSIASFSDEPTADKIY